jgi:hypothetical protein
MAAQDESLRLVAEVVDRFSGPLRNLRTMLQGVQPGPGIDKLKSGLEGGQKAATALSREVGNTLTPALNAAGIAGLSVSGALLGVGAALRSFTGSTATLALLGRETRMTVDSMRVLEEVGKRFDIAPEAMQQSFRSFAENSHQLKRGIGEVTAFLQSQSPAVARWGAQLQRDLAKGLDPDVAYRRALEFMRRIEDPIDRSRFAEKLFGNRSLGLLGSEDLSKTIDEVQRQLGKLPKGAAENALAFKHSWEAIITSLIGLRDVLAIPIMKPLKEMTDEFGRFVQSPEVKSGFSEALNTISKTLKETNWRGVGGDIVAVLGMIGSAASNTASGIRTLSEVMRALKEGRPIDAFRKLDDGILQHVVPKDVVPSLPGMLGLNKTPIEKLEKQRADLETHISRMDEIAAARRRLGAGAPGEDSQVRQHREKLTNEMRELTEEIKKLREAGATVQQQSFTGGPFGGAMIQNAAFGAMAQTGGIMRGFSPFAGGGGSGGGSRGPGAPGGAAPQGTGGSRSWRNNNPGNLEFGPFAQSMGATGSDGRFAIFPDYAAGRKAQERLLFDSKSYRDLTLGQAIARWAPGSENNVPGYIKAMGGDNPNKLMRDYGPQERARLLDLMQKQEGWRVGNRSEDTGGLRIKPGQGFSGGGVHQGVLDAAKSIQALGGVNRFTALNDRFHLNRNSRHNQGLAGDFTINDPRQSASMAEKVRELFRGSGLRDGRDFRVLDEYRSRSAGATGSHIHYELRSREAADAYRAYTIREGARRAKDMAERGTGFDETVKGLREQGGPRGFNLPKIDNGDDMLRKALKSPLMGSTAVDLKGGATLDINFKNPPPNMSTSTTMDGLFKELNLRKGASLPKAGVDI